MMRTHLFPVVLAGALAAVVACSPEQRPEAADQPPPAATPAATTAPDIGDRTAAATETADVKLAISMDKTVDASDINIDTDPATKVVTIKGSVVSAEQRARAEAIAVREAAGFRVDNQLVVKRKTD